jgi:hypothetical protein
MEDGFQILGYLHQSVTPARDKKNNSDTSLEINGTSK